MKNKKNIRNVNLKITVNIWVRYLDYKQMAYFFYFIPITFH